MKGIAKKIVSAAAAAACLIVMAVTAFADYTYSFDDEVLITEILADEYEINGSTIVLEKDLGNSESDDGMTIRFSLFNDYLNNEFWNTDEIAVSCEVMLETEGADVIGYIPGFNTSWKWINPSEFTQLKYNEWITISETGSHFYPVFSKSAPNQLLFQVRSNWDAGEQGRVKVTLRNFTIHGTPVPLDSTTVITTEDTATSVSDAEPAAPVEPVTAEAPNETPSEPAQTEPDTPANDSEPAQSSVSAADTTSIQTAAAATTASSIDYSALLERPENNLGLMIGLILGGAAIVVAAVVVGYIIYRKKKYY